jgi:hyperosmotically inducible protein
MSGLLSLWMGTPVVWSETASEGKSEPTGPPPVQRPKEPEAKPKDSEVKPTEPKAKEPEVKKEESPRAKETETKKEAESKPKEGEKPKEAETKPETKPKEPAAKAKELEHKPKEVEQKTKEPEHKPKEAEQKAKESEQKAKEAESKPKEKEPDAVAEKPCPTPPQSVEQKVTGEQPPPTGESANGERPKTAEPEGKKPMRSPMVTAKLALMADPRVFPYDIEVDAKEKDLVLLGKVASEQDKRAAAEIVRCLEGVHAVENRLKIEPDAMHGLSVDRDKVLTQLVRDRFEKSKTLQSVKFDVKTEDGIVTLSGTTRFQVIVLEAAQAARQIPGVKAVNTDGVRLVAGE